MTTEIRTPYFDIYLEDEFRQKYRELFPGLGLDDDAFFVTIETSGHRFLLDPSRSMAERMGQDAEMCCFYSEKGLKRVRAVEAACAWHMKNLVTSDDDGEAKPIPQATIRLTGKENPRD